MSDPYISTCIEGGKSNLRLTLSPASSNCTIAHPNDPSSVLKFDRSNPTACIHGTFQESFATMNRSSPDQKWHEIAVRVSETGKLTIYKGTSCEGSVPVLTSVDVKGTWAVNDTTCYVAPGFGSVKFSEVCVFPSGAGPSASPGMLALVLGIVVWRWMSK